MNPGVYIQCEIELSASSHYNIGGGGRGGEHLWVSPKFCDVDSYKNSCSAVYMKSHNFTLSLQCLVWCPLLCISSCSCGVLWACWLMCFWADRCDSELTDVFFELMMKLEWLIPGVVVYCPLCLVVSAVAMYTQ